MLCVTLMIGMTAQFAGADHLGQVLQPDGTMRVVIRDMNNNLVLGGPPIAQNQVNPPPTPPNPSSKATTPQVAASKLDGDEKAQAERARTIEKRKAKRVAAAAKRVAEDKRQQAVARAYTPSNTVSAINKGLFLNRLHGGR
jgi:hypothetical protein